MTLADTDRPRPTPADIAPAQVVTVRGRNRCWTSPPMHAAAAEGIRREFRHNVLGIGSGQGFVDFTCGDGQIADIRAREVSSVEIGPAAMNLGGQRRVAMK